MDGTNPTVVSLHRLRNELSSEAWNVWYQSLLHAFPTAAYLVSNTFQSANQCEYDLTKIKQARSGGERQQQPYEIVEKQRPPGRHHRNEVDLMLVDAQFGTLWQTTIRARTSSTTTFSADDARLLVHDGSLYVTFKRYGDHGGNGAVLYLAKLEALERQENESPESPSSFQIHATREWALCCGRNFMALSTPLKSSSTDKENMNEPTSNLSFLTWPDPIWVQSLDTRTSELSAQDASSSASPAVTSIRFDNPTESSRNALGKSSKFHGTSGFLLHLPDLNEYLGVGHIHRERKWAKDHRVDAKFGHHYTHAFFTISTTAPYSLKRLSQEFVLPSTSKARDADIIQFASGLEWAASNSNNNEGSANPNCSGLWHERL